MKIIALIFSVCWPVFSFAENGTTFLLPFDAKTEVICTHSSGSGSHSFANARYALDLAVPYEQPAPVVRASADGIAFVFFGENGALCLEPAGTPAKSEADSCGDGWGNRVKVLHANGQYSFYVHLDRALVKTGDRVKAGDPIGVMGWTGLAGHRHLHWSVQKLPGMAEAEWIREISWDGESVPFRFVANGNREFNVRDVHCAHAGIGSAPAGQQPRFTGASKNNER